MAMTTITVLQWQRQGTCYAGVVARGHIHHMHWSCTISLRCGIAQLAGNTFTALMPCIMQQVRVTVLALNRVKRSCSACCMHAKGSDKLYKFKLCSWP